MPCDLCRTLPIRTVRQLDQEIEEGEKPMDELAQEYAISAALLDIHVRRCVNPVPSSPHELLNNMMRDLRGVAEERKDQYESDPEVYGQAMTHYINLMREARETIMSMERIRPSDELAKDVFDKIINPLIRQSVIISVEEVNRLRESLVSALGSEQFELIDGSTKQTLRRLATRLKNDTGEIVEKLPSVLAPDGKKKSSRDPKSLFEGEPGSSGTIN